MPYSDYIVYVDESGDHSLASVDVQYPVFVLTFCIFLKEDYFARVVPAVQRLKFDNFGHDSVVLHERDIRMQIGPFVLLQQRAAREPFMGALNDLVAAAPMTIVTAVIQKERLRERYAEPSNPYAIALLFCVERLYAFLREKDATDRTTHIVVERRGKKEDAELGAEFQRIAGGANRWGPISCLELVFTDKMANSSGLQLADLTARPLGLKAIRPNQANRAYDIIEQKLRRSPLGRIQGWGFKALSPKSERPRFSPRPSADRDKPQST
jgi:hypothetical protein